MEQQHTYHFPLSFAQQRLWLFQQMQPQSTAYNITGALRLMGDLNIAAFEQAIQQIVNRHEVLRTTFRPHQGETVQWVQPELKITLEKRVLTQQKPDLQMQECHQLAAELADFVFDLQTAPLIKLQLLTLSEGEYVFLSVVHHIISDGWSMGVFVDELMTLYAAYQQGQADILPELEIQYGDYALWQQEWFTGDIKNQQISYWQKQLEGMPPLLTLPTDFPRPAMQNFLGATTSVQLSEKITDDLKKLAAQQGATLNMVLLSAFFTLLHRYSQEQDLVVGTPVANRNQHELEPLIGFFVNTLVLRPRVQPDSSFQVLLQQVKAMSIAALEYQDCPFEQLLEQLKHTRNLSYSPLIQALFSYQNVAEKTFELPNVSISQLQLQRTNAQFDLTLIASENQLNISLEFGFNRELFKTETVVAMASHFVSLCAAVACKSDLPLTAIPLTESSEIPVIQSAWRNMQTVALKTPQMQALINGLLKQSSDSVLLEQIVDKLQFYILDKDLNPVPFGMPGELCIGGLTNVVENLKPAGCIQPDSFDSDLNARLYKTTQQVKFSPSQGFEFFSPTEQAVNAKRFRIDLSQMQQVLNLHSAVKQALVVTSTDNNQKSYITAYIVSQNKNITVEELDDYLAEQLPQYILPQKWLSLDALPLTPSGDIDQLALQGSAVENISLHSPLTAPENKIEEQLIFIWQQVLFLKEIGTEHNFFDLGGHSLNASQIVTRIKQLFDIDMPMRVVFEKPSIKQQAEWILSTQFEALDDAEQAELLDELAQLSDDELGFLG